MKMKQLEGLMEVERVEEDSELVMHFPAPYGVFDSNENMISIKDVSFAWPGQEPLFEKVDFCIGTRARLAILGKNGCGVNVIAISAFSLTALVQARPVC